MSWKLGNNRMASSRSSNSVYLFISCLWSAAVFTILLPEFKHLTYSRCVWQFSFKLCDRFLGIEGSYRFTLAVVSFYFILSLVTINLDPKYSTWIHEDCWIWKVVLFGLTNLVAFIIPFTKLIVKIMYNVLLSVSMCFIITMFLIAIDAAHALKVLWLCRARKSANDATCYLCTVLFLKHFTTSILYAMSLNMIAAFFFFNKIGECVNTTIFLFVNVFVCLLCIVLSYFPSLRERYASSQIIFATVLFMVVYTTWVALSDPGNESCNLYGTIFTGSLLDGPFNLRSMSSITIAFVMILFVCYKGDTRSYIRSLMTDKETTEYTFHIYSKFHLIMAAHSCFFLISATNFYEPVYSVLAKTETAHDTASTIYFEGYSWPKFLILSGVSTALPLSYLALLVICTVNDCVRDRKVRKDEIDAAKKQTKKASQLPAFQEIIRDKAVKMLKSHPANNSPLDAPTIDPNIHLIECFRVKNFDISFWNFPRNVSQTYFNGRNGSNACTVIALIIGRYFSRSDIPFQDNGHLQGTWSSLFHNSISEGNSLYDAIVKDVGVLDLSIEEVFSKLGKKLNMARVLPSLAVSFHSEVETATMWYQLDQLVKINRKQVVLMIHKRRTSAFLIYQDGSVVYTDSHAFGNNGALMIVSYEFNIQRLLDFIRDILGSNDNKLSTLTVVEYESRHILY